VDETTKTFSLRYIGDRFEGGRLPVDVLSDLSALRDLIASLAKQAFLRDNPDRRRMPQGFDKSISFALVGVEEGSAIPIFCLEQQIVQQNLPGIGDGIGEIVEKAYQRVTEIIAGSDNKQSVLDLPQSAIRALSKLGANLRENEQIEFRKSGRTDEKIVALDNFRRKKLLTNLRETYTVEFEGVGYLAGVDSNTNIIKVNTDKYGELVIPLWDMSAWREFDGSIGTLVEVSVVLALDKNDQVRSVESVHSIDLVRPYDEHLEKCLARLHNLAKLERGWLDGGGEPLTHIAAAKTLQFIFTYAELAKLFRIYPTEDGGVSIEFGVKKWDFVVEILPDGAIETDGSSSAKEALGPETFNDLSEEFSSWFNNMVLVNFNDKS